MEKRVVGDMANKRIHKFHLYCINLYYRNSYDSNLYLEIKAGMPDEETELQRLADIQRDFGIYVHCIEKDEQGRDLIIEITLKP